MKRLLLLTIALFSLLIVGSAFASDKVIEKISAGTALQKVKAGAMLVDVRRPDEFALGHLNSALNIPHEDAERRLAEFGTDKDREIVVYCRSGKRAAIVQEILAKAGYSHVSNAGGYEELQPVFK